jgi:predicted metal-dependent phosphoesterase TrpH
MTLASSQKKADLHIHTNYSDGLLTPQQVVEYSRRKNLSTISITDHDSVSGVGVTLSLAGSQLEVIPGVELSTTYEDIDVHILGYYLDHKAPALVGYLADLQGYRERRAQQIVEKLARHGVTIEYERVRTIAGPGAIGRPHIAAAMQERGFVSTVDEAFNRFIGYRGPCYVPKKELDPRGAISIINEFDGIAVLAHPGVYNCDRLLTDILGCGIEGVEVWHPEHSRSVAEKLLKFAGENGLVVTGGSDCHGGHKGRQVLIGQILLDECYVQALRERAKGKHYGRE